MKEGEYVQVVVIIDKESFERRFGRQHHKSSGLFDILVHNGLDIKEVAVHDATVRKMSRLELEVCGNGHSTSSEDWNN